LVIISGGQSVRVVMLGEEGWSGTAAILGLGFGGEVEEEKDMAEEGRD